MKVDYHIHLEEGPYSLSFVEKSLEAMEHFEPVKGEKNTKEWMNSSIARMNKRLTEGEYSEWWLDFYLQEALNKGIEEVGIVDHLYRFTETRDYFTKNIDINSEEIGEKQLAWLNKVMVRSLEDFVILINKAKKKWAKKGVKLKLGMEADYFVDSEEELKSILSKYEFDYVIGSVHFYNGWGFDNPDLQHIFRKHDLNAVYRDHFETIKMATKSGIFNFIAHLDNIKVFNHRPDEASLTSVYIEVAKTLAENNIATEVNPGLYYRYPVKEMCPSPKFLEILVKEGVNFTCSSDSHFPNDLGIFNEDIKAMLITYGVKEVATFERGKRVMKSFNPNIT